MDSCGGSLLKARARGLLVLLCLLAMGSYLTAPARAGEKAAESAAGTPALSGAVSAGTAPEAGAGKPATGKPGKAHSLPITITADTMKADRTTKTVVFKGNVEAREDFLLCSDELHMEYKGANEVRKIDALGHVRIYRETGVAVADHAEYDRQEHTLLLTGEARIEGCADTVSGDRITLYLDDNSALVEGERGGRVRAVIIPDKKCAGAGTAGKGGGTGAAPSRVIDVKSTHCKGTR